MRGPILDSVGGPVSHGKAREPRVGASPASGRARLRGGLGSSRNLTPLGWVSLAGLVAAGVVAVGLGLFITRQVEQHMLEAEAEAAEQVEGTLAQTRVLPTEQGADLTALDVFARRVIADGRIARVKFWAPDGTILYSDEARLIGQRFPVQEDLASALGGHKTREISELGASENRFERPLAGRLLEVYLPVREGGRVVGAWEIYRSLDAFDDENGDVRRIVWVSVGSGLGVLLVFLISSFGSMFGVVERRRREAVALNAELEAAERERRVLTTSLVSAHEEERREIVGEIHDGLGQDLHRVLFGLRGCLSGSADEVRPELGRMELLVDASIRRLRRLLEGLRPAALEDVGLAASLRGLVDRVRLDDDLDVEFEVTGSGLEPQPDARVAVFRIAQEALRNVARHSGTKHARVELHQDDAAVTVRVSDHGAGVPASGRTGLGTWLMRERAEALGGEFRTRSDASGTTVSARIPITDVDQ